MRSTPYSIAPRHAAVTGGASQAGLPAVSQALLPVVHQIADALREDVAQDLS